MEAILDPVVVVVLSLEDISTIVGGAGDGDGESGSLLRLRKEGPSISVSDSDSDIRPWGIRYCLIVDRMGA